MTQTTSSTDTASTGRAVPDQRGPVHEVRPMTAGALLEQAKGVLVFRYSIDAHTALGVLELWAAEAGTEPTTLAYALVHDICQGDQPRHSDPALVRWLEDRLRRDCPELSFAVASEVEPVVVVVDHSYSSLDAVVAAARDASRLGVPLQITVAPPTGERHDEHTAGAVRAQLIQRVDLAVELARAVEPGLDVRLPACNFLSASP